MMLYKLVVLGDGGVGKTALTIQLMLQHFVEHASTDISNSKGIFLFLFQNDPTIEDSYRTKVVIDGQPCMLEVLDTAGLGEYTALRDQWIRTGEGFLLVYSISSRLSFIRIREFHSQIQRVKGSSESSPSYTGSPISSEAHSTPVPVMLVGNKSDRVREREVSTHEGQALAQKLGCRFLEASAKNCVAVEDAFYDAVRQLRRQGTPGTIGEVEMTRGRPRMEICDRKTREARIYRLKKDKGKCVIL